MKQGQARILRPAQGEEGGNTLRHRRPTRSDRSRSIRNFNEIAASQTIQAGNILLIPVKDTVRSARVASRPSYRNPELPRDAVSLPLLSAADGGKQIRYIVKKDDTIVRIAERFHASLAQIREWNASHLRFGAAARRHAADTHGHRPPAEGSRRSRRSGRTGRNERPGGNRAARIEGDPAAGGERATNHPRRQKGRNPQLHRPALQGAALRYPRWNQKDQPQQSFIRGNDLTIWVKARAKGAHPRR